MRVRTLLGAAAVLLGPVLLPAQSTTATGDAVRITGKSWAATDDQEAQFKRDVAFFYATLFPDPAMLKALGSVAQKNPALASGLQETQRTNQILGRLFVAMAYGGLQYCTQKNDTPHLQDWKWQLATALGHGQRVVFDLKGFDSFDFYNLLVNGEVKAGFTDPYSRSAASHGFEWSDGRLKELKYSGLSLVYALTDGFQGRHHGINLAFGGLGNDRPDQYEVGPGGFAMDPANGFRLLSDLQQGHLYLHHANHVENKKIIESGLMVGLETCAPGTRNLYGGEHTAASASKDATVERSVDGGQKMQKLLGAEAPAETGGMWVRLGQDQFQELQGVLKTLDGMDDKARRALFKTLLADDGPSAKKDVEAAFALNPAPRGRR